MKTTGATSAQDFWNAAKPLIDVTEQHPFLVSMVDGTLALENFRYYVIQDALYLQDFADCLCRLGDLAATVTVAQRQQERNKVDAKNGEQESTISTTISHHSTRLHKFGESVKQAEMELHKTFFQQWDISGADGGVDDQKPNTLLYTSYMKRIVATRPYAEGLATLLPCFWVYMHVGKCMLQLRDKLGDSVERPAQFDAWIDMYGGDDFEREVLDYIALVDDTCKTASAETLQEMERHFIMSCKLEHMFWDQAEALMDWPKILRGSDS